MKKIIISLIPFLLLFGCNEDDNNYNIQEPIINLPIISINTEDLLPIVSKEEYINGTFEISDENTDYSLLANFKIRGRGNSTWSKPKKPYQIKFDSKEKIPGMSEDKKWILLANYTDKTMLRNEVAFDLSRFSNLDWTPESRFVELFINSEYLGVYQIT